METSNSTPKQTSGYITSMANQIPTANNYTNSNKPNRQVVQNTNNNEEKINITTPTYLKTCTTT